MGPARCIFIRSCPAGSGYLSVFKKSLYSQCQVYFPCRRLFPALFNFRHSFNRYPDALFYQGKYRRNKRIRHGPDYLSFYHTGRSWRRLLCSSLFCQYSAGIFSVQQAHAPRRNILKSYKKYDYRYTRQKTRQSVELSGSYSYLRRI